MNETYGYPDFSALVKKETYVIPDFSGCVKKETYVIPDFSGCVNSRNTAHQSQHTEDFENTNAQISGAGFLAPAQPPVACDSPPVQHPGEAPLSSVQPSGTYPFQPALYAPATAPLSPQNTALTPPVQYPTAVPIPIEVSLVREKGVVNAALEDQKHYHKMEEIQVRNECNIRRDEAAEERREKRERASLTAIEEGDGYIVIQKKVPGGKTTYSEPVLTWPYVRMKKLVRASTGECAAQVIQWRGRNGDDTLILKKMTTAAFVKKMMAAGNVFKVGRDRRREIDDLVYGYLTAKAGVVELPDHRGWNKINGVWAFAGEDDDTIESLLKEGMNQ